MAAGRFKPVYDFLRHFASPVFHHASRGGHAV